MKFWLFIMLCFVSCSNESEKKLKLPVAVCADGFDNGDTIEQLGMLRLPKFRSTLDSTANITLVSYKINDSIPIKKIHISKIKVLTTLNPNDTMNQLFFTFNDTLREGMKYEIVVNVNGKNQRNIYSDFLFQKVKFPSGWHIRLKSYKKNGVVFYIKKKQYIEELDW